MYMEIGAKTAAAGGSGNPALRHSFFPAGAEPTVIAVHGASADLDIWNETRQRLLPGCRFVAHAPAVANVEQGQDLVDLIHELGAGAAHLIGWGRGGRTALKTALAYPDLVRSVTLCDPDIGEVLHHMPGGDRIDADYLWEIFGLVRGPDTDLTPACHPCLTAAAISKIAVPALVMTGELSHPRQQIIVEWLAAHISGAKEKVWAGIGHRDLLESPEVADELADFVSSV